METYTMIKPQHHLTDKKNNLSDFMNSKVVGFMTK